MAGIGLTPSRPVVAENVRDLQRWARHARCTLGGRLVLGFTLLGHQRCETIKRAHDLADRVGGDAGVERRRFQFGMSKKHLNHTNIDILLKQVSRKGVPLIPSSE